MKIWGTNKSIWKERGPCGVHIVRMGPLHFVAGCSSGAYAVFVCHYQCVERLRL